MLILIVAGGPDKGRIYELSEDQPVVLGREGDPIKFNDRKTSRKHARLWAEGGRWYVRDLNSRHGTYLNNQSIDNKVELNDGDHIQIGRSLCVLARMPAEAAERLALLGADASGDATGGRLVMGPAAASGWRRPHKILAAGAAMAAMVLIGSNVMLYLNSMEQADQWREDRDQLLAEIRTSTGAAAPTSIEPAPILHEILAAVQAQQRQTELLNHIGETVAAQPNNTALLESILAKVQQQPPMAKSIKSMLARLESQPSTQVVLDEVLAVADAAEARQAALAAQAKQTDALLGQALAKLESQPDVEQLVQGLRDAAQAQARDSAQLLETVLANLDQQKALAQQVAQLRELIAQQPQTTRTALRDIVQSMPEHDPEAVLASIAELRQTLPTDVSDKLDQVLAQLAVQPTPEQLAAAVTSVIDPSREAAAQALGRIADRLDAQPTREDLIAVLDQAATGTDPALLAKLDELSATLKQAQVLRTAQAQQQDITDEQAAQLAQQQAATQKLLTQVLGEVRNREPIQQLRTQLEQLAQANDAQTGDQAAKQTRMLNELLAAVKAGDPDTQVVARLAEVHDLIAAWPDQTEAMMREVIAAVQEQPASPAQTPAAPALNDMLRDIRSRALARIDELNAALRHDLRRELQQQFGQDFRLDGAAPVDGEPLREAAARPTPSRPQPRRTRSTRPRSVLMAPQASQTQTIRVTEPMLSEVEQAYKLAFETGQPVTIGAGILNVVSGEVSEGRTLDPAAARAAGIEHWRQWYLMDDFAERMRLQKQAMRYGGADARQSVISLPGAPALLLPPVVADDDATAKAER